MTKIQKIERFDCLAESTYINKKDLSINIQKCI